MPLYLDLNLIKIIKPSNTTLGESQFTRYSVKLPGPGNFTEYLVTCDSPSVVFDGLISLIKFKSKYNGMENIKYHYLLYRYVATGL